MQIGLAVLANLKIGRERLADRTKNGHLSCSVSGRESRGETVDSLSQNRKFAPLRHGGRRISLVSRVRSWTIAIRVVPCLDSLPSIPRQTPRRFRLTFF